MQIIINQILIMAILILVGYILFKRGYLNQDVTKKISEILLRLIMPLTIVESFMIPFSIERFIQLVLVIVITIIITIVFFYITRLYFKDDQRIEQYAAIFSNKGFIGIPIISALFNIEAIQVLAPVIVISNIFQWTFGLSLLNSEKIRLDVKKLFNNPSIIGLMIGLLCFFLPISFPYPINQSIKYLTSINTPLAMLIIGTYLAEEKMTLIFTNKAGYQVALMRLIIMPLLVLLFVKFLPIDYVAKAVLVISFAVPSAANTAMFAQLTGKNYSFGAQIVSLTTILSAFTLPLILYFMEIVL